MQFCTYVQRPLALSLAKARPVLAVDTEICFLNDPQQAEHSKHHHPNAQNPPLVTRRMRKQKAHTLPIMRPPNSLRKRRANIHNP
jgi:hypothetical protein